MFQPGHILVAGGCGFMGSNFVHWVACEHPGVRMTVLDALTYAGNPANLEGLPEGRVELVVGDVCDGDLVGGLMARADVCVHFAAETHVDRSIADPAPFLRANVEGTMRLLEEAYGGFEADLRETEEMYAHRGGGERVCLCNSRLMRITTFSLSRVVNSVRSARAPRCDLEGSSGALRR